ncbi:alpha/beta-hydrolase, partial [Atractiella rhizophila]
PYAQPPVGALRFANPVAVTSYSGVFDGTVTPNSCPQTNYYNPSLPSNNEDCLWLTVYTPRNADANSNLPVMIWVHGGSFASGGIMNPGLDGSKVAATGTIVIFVQYRLGMLGFLRASGIGVDGNYGTRDVQLALQWVQSNIAAYGGDPAKVTLAGQSSGASMVCFHSFVSRCDLIR